MIKFNYDPIFGLVSYKIEEPERVPFNSHERGEHVKRLCDIVLKRTRPYTRDKLVNQKEQKQTSAIWQEKALDKIRQRKTG